MGWGQPKAQHGIGGTRTVQLPVCQWEVLLGVLGNDDDVGRHVVAGTKLGTEACSSPGADSPSHLGMDEPLPSLPGFIHVTELGSSSSGRQRSAMAVGVTWRSSRRGTTPSRPELDANRRGLPPHKSSPPAHSCTPQVTTIKKEST